MKQKFESAKRMKEYGKEWFKDNKTYKKMYRKCYRAYILAIMTGRNKFKIKFKGGYYESLGERIVDWLKYIGNNFMVRILGKDRCIYDCYKPIHVKLGGTPNEAILEKILRQGGLEIVDEFLSSTDNIYKVAII